MSKTPPFDFENSPPREEEMVGRRRPELGKGKYHLFSQENGTDEENTFSSLFPFLL
jgi:hypothetical protein